MLVHGRVCRFRGLASISPPFRPRRTPNYIAPEVLTSKDVNGYSFNIDIWSLGMTVIEMLTAEMPFCDFSNPFAVMFQIARIKDVPTTPDFISSEASEFLKRCLRVDPLVGPSSIAPAARDIPAPFPQRCARLAAI